MAEQFKVIFQGELTGSTPQVQVQQQLAELLGITGRQAAGLFSGCPVVVRRGVDLATARNLARQFSRCGARCRIVEMKTTPAPCPDPSPQGAVERDAAQVICPGCATPQPAAAECLRCGLIFAKYRGGDASRQAEPSEAPPTPNPASSRAKGFLEVMVRLRRAISRRFFSNQATGEPFSAAPVRRWVDALLQSVVIIVLVDIAITGLLIFTKAMWHIYIATPVGERFMLSFGEPAQAMVALMELDFVLLAMRITGRVFGVCLGLAAVCQLSHLARLLYHTRNIIAKLLFWATPLSLGLSRLVSDITAIDYGPLNITLAAVAVGMLMPCTFAVTDKAIPELGEILTPLIPLWGRLQTVVLTKFGLTAPERFDRPGEPRR